jgi:predicted alpha/beta hydrolase family esterase
MKKKYQLLFIHGGTTFENRSDYLQFLKTRQISLAAYQSFSGEYLEKALGAEYQIIRLKMPLKENAKYLDWQIYFERFFNLLDKKIVLIGNSLGGVFLAKYLSERELKKSVPLVILIAPPFSSFSFKLKKDLSLVEKNVDNLYLLFSADDEVVDLSHKDKYQAKLNKADIRVYKNKNGHFRISTFKELINIIKKHED